MKQLLRIGLASLISLTLSFPLLADEGETKEEKAIEYRKGAFTIAAWHFHVMADMIKGEREFDADVFAEQAANVAAVSGLPIHGFIPGSDKGDTEAKPEVWEKWDMFTSGLEKFDEEAKKLAEVAKMAESLSDVAPQFKATGKVCKDCHDNFKE